MGLGPSKELDIGVSAVRSVPKQDSHPPGGQGFAEWPNPWKVHTEPPTGRHDHWLAIVRPEQVVGDPASIHFDEVHTHGRFLLQECDVVVGRPSLPGGSDASAAANTVLTLRHLGQERVGSLLFAAVPIWSVPDAGLPARRFIPQGEQ